MPTPLEYRPRLVELVRFVQVPEKLSREYESSAKTIREWVESANAIERGLVRTGERIDPEAGFAFMKAHQTEHSISFMARVLGLSKTGYYPGRSTPDKRQRVV